MLLEKKEYRNPSISEWRENMLGFDRAKGKFPNMRVHLENISSYVDTVFVTKQMMVFQEDKGHSIWHQQNVQRVPALRSF